MIYYLLGHLGGAFNVFRYITFRGVCAMVTALSLSHAAYPQFIAWLQRKRMEQTIRADGPEGHLKTKVGTPTMGGMVIHLALTVTTLLWARLDEPRVWMVLAVTLGYAAIGFVDDWKKVTERNSAGLAGRWKILGQVLIGASVLGYGYGVGLIDASLHLPFLKEAVIDFAHLWHGAPPALGWVYVGVGVFILVGSSNAVNLTDGLDGLAIGSTITTGATFAVLAYLAGHAAFSTYLNIPHVEGAGELAIFAAAIVGVGLGFLWYNCYPAQLFMGDVGALGLGGALGVLAVLTKQEVLLALVGGIFVMEALSVIIQVVSFRGFGRRVFLMTPIHHHYEKDGWCESKIIVRFWIISVLLALVTLSTLKLR